MSDWVNFLEKNIFNGKKSFTTIFITSWMLWNWQIIVVLFFDNSFPDIEKISKIPKILELIQTFVFTTNKNASIITNEFLIPFIISLTRYFFINYAIEFIEMIRKNCDISMDNNGVFAIFTLFSFIFPFNCIILIIYCQNIKGAIIPTLISIFLPPLIIMALILKHKNDPKKN